MSLIDRQLSSSDMFGGDPSVLLRWENVYYRKAATSQKILKAPGRILWYVSRSQKQIVAVSHLDEVVSSSIRQIGSPVLRGFLRPGAPFIRGPGAVQSRGEPFSAGQPE